MPSRLTILGSGMGGLGAAARARAEHAEHVIYEAKSYGGGHTSTHIREGFVFDEGPHVSITKNDCVRQMFAEAIDNQYETINANIDNYWQGRWIVHPAVTNLYGLPSRLVTDVIRDYVEAKEKPNQSIANYEDWLIASYG